MMDLNKKLDEYGISVDFFEKDFLNELEGAVKEGFDLNILKKLPYQYVSISEQFSYIRKLFNKGFNFDRFSLNLIETKDLNLMLEYLENHTIEELDDKGYAQYLLVLYAIKELSFIDNKRYKIYMKDFYEERFLEIDGADVINGEYVIDLRKKPETEAEISVSEENVHTISNIRELFYKGNEFIKALEKAIEKRNLSEINDGLYVYIEHINSDGGLVKTERFPFEVVDFVLLRSAKEI